MFINDADTTCLRQGDILANIPFPMAAAQKTSFLGTASIHAPGDLAFAPQSKVIRNLPMYVCQVEARIGFGAVITQCCDLEPRDGNRIEQPMIAVARLNPIPPAVLNDINKMEDLRSNSDPRLPGAGFL